ncbi:Possible carboxymuconolactone decarboxylase family protein (EC 4.1.1.44), partial [Sideroxydans sp. CL21]
EHIIQSTHAGHQQGALPVSQRGCRADGGFRLDGQIRDGGRRAIGAEQGVDCDSHCGGDTLRWLHRLPRALAGAHGCNARAGQRDARGVCVYGRWPVADVRGGSAACLRGISDGL